VAVMLAVFKAPVAKFMVNVVILLADVVCVG
jgi:hypothetical protein